MISTSKYVTKVVKWLYTECRNCSSKRCCQKQTWASESRCVKC